MALDTCKPTVGEHSPSNKLPHHSPLKCKGEFWSQEWVSHIDHGYVTFIGGNSKWVSIGFNQRCYLFSCSDNMSIKNPTMVSEYLQREVPLGKAYGANHP